MGSIGALATIAAKSSLFRLAPPTKRAADPRQRQDRTRVGGIDRAAIEDAHVLALGAQMLDETLRMCACM